jgi:hypothetical protein
MRRAKKCAAHTNEKQRQRPSRKRGHRPIFKEHIFRDKDDPTIQHDVITTIAMPCRGL